jgi:membrane protein DedA with SNARE-associated domain
LQEQFLAYLQQYGYWILFVWTFMEGEAGLILAGFWASQGHLHLAGVILVALLGGFCGDQFYFYLGRWQGVFLLKVFTAFSRKFRKALRLIERYGTFVAFISRYTYGFRILLPLILGMSSFSAVRFCWLNLLSAVVWAIAFSLAGYLFGKSAAFFVEDVSRHEHVVIAVLLSLITLAWLTHLVIARRRRGPARERLARMRRNIGGR